MSAIQTPSSRHSDYHGITADGSARRRRRKVRGYGHHLSAFAAYASVLSRRLRPFGFVPDVWRVWLLLFQFGRWSYDSSLKNGQIERRQPQARMMALICNSGVASELQKACSKTDGQTNTFYPHFNHKRVCSNFRRCDIIEVHQFQSRTQFVPVSCETASMVVR